MVKFGDLTMLIGELDNFSSKISENAQNKTEI